MITTAQFTYIPLRETEPRESIDYLLELVAQHDVDVDVNYLSTSVRGDTEVVFELIREIYDTMTLEGQDFRFHVELLSPVPQEDQA
ncbi:MAG: YkoF family thiamine/hydroxymethylpyrimidine-binding protein [Balneolaceae bacterium]|nr:YkoF family thiamine/hydroxymethylpyrimidine-binding protein [Balneolaceae bacterium]